MHVATHHPLLKRLARISVLVLALQAWPLQAVALDVRAEVAGFFQDYLGRSLTAPELDEAVTDYQSFFGDPEHCNSECEEALASHRAGRAYFTQTPDTPEELLLRHVYLSNAVFDPRNQGGIILRLLSEPDPIAAVDYKAQRIMTKRDLEALYSLLTLPQAGELRAAPELSPKEFAQIKNQIAVYFKNANENKLVTLFVIAAELYTGMRRDWATLSESDRAATLAYLEDKGVGRALPARLYQQFLGIDAQEAQQIATKQAYEALNKTFALARKLTRLQMGATVVEQLGRFAINPSGLPQP